ncbi:MAG: 1-(5-phosphoribosyl)-5-[(5-phosphoribosylamino)methylideneamino]imidazole-4-carboxamide isomerase [Legionellales bacterium]|nr:1-(5-phosphoribosyl)-5-[(5-phosphoribosylamino)methylideneamino]imidazole-4-carboxamide isomerase [Legionellales bacterium]
MQIIPAIDIQSGQCVRLYQGDFDQTTVYSNDPVSVAKEYTKEGIQWLHLVDLDGAQDGEALQVELILDIVRQTSLQVQVGGGLRTFEIVKKLLDGGVQRVVIGSLAAFEPETVKQWIVELGAQSIVLALDVQCNEENIPYIVTQGWQQQTTTSLWRLLKQYEDCGLQHILCTDIEMDGTLRGPNLQLYAQCQQHYPQLQFQASGGVGKLSHIQALQELGVASAIVGKALYEKQFTLAQALTTVQNAG